MLPGVPHFRPQSPPPPPPGLHLPAAETSDIPVGGTHPVTSACSCGRERDTARRFLFPDSRVLGLRLPSLCTVCRNLALSWSPIAVGSAP